MFLRIYVVIVALPTALMLAGCGSSATRTVPVLPGIVPHRIDIQQGNVITQDMLDKLQPGMTRSQVRFVLGTPLLVDLFRSDRWDYFYSLVKQGDRVEQRQLRVYFKDDRMLRYEGDIVSSKPTSESAAAGKPAAKPAPAAVAPAPAAVTPAAAAATPAPEPVKPAAALPRDTPAAADLKPNLRLSPSEGEPAKPEEKVAPAAAAEAAPAVTPAEPQALEAPPLPRLQLPPEPEEKPAAAATTPDTPAKP